MRKLIFMDLDGTLVHPTKPVIDYGDPLDVACCKPDENAVERARLMRDRDGFDVHVLTGRTWYQTGQVTENQVRTLLPDAHIFQLPCWQGWDALRNFKATILRSFQPSLYVGDLDLDREAAQRAGVPFMLAADWALNEPLPWEVAA